MTKSFLQDHVACVFHRYQLFRFAASSAFRRMYSSPSKFAQSGSSIRGRSRRNGSRCITKSIAPTIPNSKMNIKTREKPNPSKSPEFPCVRFLARIILHPFFIVLPLEAE